MSREIICFHNPGEKNGYLSNWYMSEFVMDEITFSSMEKYMMYQKAKTFQDQENLENILQSDDVAQIKEYGRRVKIMMIQCGMASGRLSSIMDYWKSFHRMKN